MRITHALLSLLFAVAMPALGANYVVGVGDDCEDPKALGPCFWPQTLIISVGQTVAFVYYADSTPTGLHNVVADDGSFRCARGCDGEGTGCVKH